MMASRKRQPGETTGTVRLITLACGLSLAAASLIHFGLIFDGYQHREAAIAEAVIGGVMLAGLTLTWLSPPWSRRAAVAALLFGLLGTSVGVFTILVGIGPRTVPDVVYHGALLAALITGLSLALRSPP